MRKIKLKVGRKIHKIEIFESLFEAPTNRVHKFYEFLIYLANLAPTPQGVLQKAFNVQDLIGQKKYQEAQREAVNFYVSLNSVINNIDYSNHAFAVLIKSIDGKQIETLDEKKLVAISKKLMGWGLSLDHVVDVVEAVKKNLNPSYQPIGLYCPPTNREP